MKLEVMCEHCGYGDLQETETLTLFYCPTCDEEYTLHELDYEVIKEGL